MTDLDRTPEWNRETTSTVWVPPDTGPRVGARFDGTNEMGTSRWTVRCHVITADRPRRFAWTVLEPEHPSSTWWYRLEPEAGATVLHHGFQHGPNVSGVRAAIDADPASAEQIIAGRTEMLRANMRHTLEAIRGITLAEGTLSFDYERQGEE